MADCLFTSNCSHWVIASRSLVWDVFVGGTTNESFCACVCVCVCSSSMNTPTNDLLCFLLPTVHSRLRRFFASVSCLTESERERAKEDPISIMIHWEIHLSSSSPLNSIQCTSSGSLLNYQLNNSVGHLRFDPWWAREESLVPLLTTDCRFSPSSRSIELFEHLVPFLPVRFYLTLNTCHRMRTSQRHSSLIFFFFSR